MKSKSSEAREAKSSLASLTTSLPRLALRLAALVIIDSFSIVLIYTFIHDGLWPLAALITFTTIVVNVINLWERFFPLRWMSGAIAIILLFVLYPIIFTVYTAFTNYSDGHLLTKVQSIRRIGQDTFLPEGGVVYNWTAFRSPDGEFLLWLTAADGNAYLGRASEPLTLVTTDTPGLGSLDENGIPTTIEGYTRLGLPDILPILDSALAPLEFGEPPLTVKISSIREASQLQPRYVYAEQRDAITDSLTGITYPANDKTGFFESAEGTTLNPGYQVTIGFSNFERLLVSPALRGPFVQIFIWTVVFAVVSVVSTFALGLFLALVYNDPTFRGRKLVRTLLIIPYAMPGVIGILIWRGMLNQHFGVIATNMIDLIGWSPGWFTDPIWSKVGILLVNLWLGFPYMMLICSGALQSVPTDIYEAAEVDGATRWQSFWRITLPLLLVAVGPLLIASFTFNFNNFTVIYAYNEGRPPIPNTATPAGYTDILISYTFRLAFESGRGADYGYANAITIVIFMIVAAITIFQYRFMGMWEEVSENV
ncbi:MAG: maltose ABC transporter permease MalF [Anaerolineales bacterium]